MKRTLFSFGAFLLMAFAFGGMAQATSDWGKTWFSVTSGKVGNNGFSSLTYADGTVREFAAGSYSKSTYQGQATSDYLTYVNDMQGDLYQPWANQYLNPEYQGAYSNTYYHFSYMNMINGARDSANKLTGGTINVEFDVKNLAGEKQTVGTAIDFKWYQHSDGSSWLVFTEVAWSLGSVTDHLGNEFNLYLELKNQPTDEEGGYTTLTSANAGALYDDILAGTGLEGNPKLYAFMVPSGQDQWFAFKASAYGSAIDPYATPIPGAVWLMGTGAAGLVALHRGRKRKQA